MIEFKSILAEEMNSFLSLYEQEVGKESYYIATRHLIKFDEYLSGISCSDKNLTEQQIYDWLGIFDIKKSSICKIVTVLRGFLRHLEGYGYRPFIPPYPKVRDDYVAYIATAVSTCSPAESSAATAADGTAQRSGTRRKNASGPSGSAIRNTKTRSAAPRLTSTRHR